MPGIEIFSRINVGKETVHGTAVARTRRFYGVVAGNFSFDDVWNFHELENRGSRVGLSRAPTFIGTHPKFKIADSDGIGYDDLVEFWSAAIIGGKTGVGGGADKTWTFTPNLTTSNVLESFSMDVGDDTQNWVFDYCQVPRWKLSATTGEKTHFEADVFAQEATKGAASTPAENATPRIPADLWTAKFAATLAGLPGASIQTNFLRTWDFEYNDGNVARDYLDGTQFFGQAVEAGKVTGNLTMDVESTAFAVSEFVDKWRAGTLDFVRLKATGPVLGGSNYSLQIDIPIYYSNVVPISAVSDGVNLYHMEAKYYASGTDVLTPVLVGSLAAIP